MAATPEALRKALKANREYQAGLYRRLEESEVAIIDISNKIRETSRARRNIPRSLALKNLIGFPPVIDARGQAPPPTEDQPLFDDLHEKIPVVHTVNHWTEAELASLAAGVKSCNQKLFLGRILAQYDQDTLSEEEKSKLNEQLRVLDNNPQLVLSNTDGVDWEYISVHKVKTRSATECKLRWMGNEDPRINKAEWTDAECGSLIQLAEANGCRHWQKVARELGTNRTALQCFQKYQSNFNYAILKIDWTPEEDDRLRTLVAEYDGDFEMVAEHMEGRTDSQCLFRWRNSSQAGIKSGRWSWEEDVALILAHKAYPGQWSVIQKMCPGRTSMKCRERYVNVLDPQVQELKNQQWSREEDAKLKVTVGVHGVGSWSKIASEMGLRTDNQCYRRWRLIATEEELQEYARQTDGKRKLILSNSAGRFTRKKKKITLESLLDIEAAVAPDPEPQPESDPQPDIQLPTGLFN